MINELEFTKEIKELNERYIYKKDNTKKEEGIEAFVELKKYYQKSLYSYIKNINDKAISEWISKVENTYNSFIKRNDIRIWQELLQIEDQDKDNIYMYIILIIFMQDKYVCSDVIRILNNKFCLVEKRLELYKVFPEEYINNFLRKINKKEYPDYEFFNIEECKEYDKFMELFYKLDYVLDSKEEFNLLFKEIKNLKIDHPELDLKEFMFYIDSKNPVNLIKVKKIVSKIEKQYPNSKYSNLLNAMFSLRIEKYKKAEEYYKKVLEEDKYNYLAMDIIVCYVAQKKAEEAKDMIYYLLKKDKCIKQEQFYLEMIADANSILFNKLKKSIKKNDDNISKLELAFLYDEIVEYDKSLKVLDTVHIDKETEIVYYALKSMVYLDTNESNKAIECINKWEEKLKALDEITKSKLKDIFSYKLGDFLEHETFILYKGLVYSQANKKQEAIDFINSSICLSLDNIQLVLLKINLLYDLGLYEEAILLCDEILSQFGELNVYLDKIKCLYKLNRLFDAYEVCDQALKEYQHTLDFYICKIKILLDLNSFDAAEKLLTFLEGKGIKDINILYFKLVILNNKGQVEEAKRIYSKLKKQIKCKKEEIYEFILDDVMCLVKK